ncbi:MAG: hypothetical protein ACREJ0_04025 [Geminicoccaceae bacterium]
MTSMEGPKREYLPKAQSKYRAWRFWQSLWKATNFIVGGSAAGLSALIAANVESQFLGPTLTVALATLAAVLAFAQTALQPSAQAAGCEIAARELEKAIARYMADPTKDDVFLADAVERGIDLLSGVK